MGSPYVREDRKKLFKHRVANNLTDFTDFSTWNASFTALPVPEQIDRFREMENSKMIPCSLDCCDTPAPKSLPKYRGEIKSAAVAPSSSNSQIYYNSMLGCWANKQDKEKEQTMRIETISVAAQAPKSEISTQRDFLLGELNKISREKYADLRKDFFLDDDEAPKTIKERKQRVADGKYVIDFRVSDDDYEDEYEYYGVGRGTIRWRDPAKPADPDGYKAATDKMDTEATRLRRLINIKDADAGLEAITGFESATFH